MVHDSQPGPNDEVEFDGVGVSELVLLGRVMSIQDQNMKTVVELSDSTGFYDVVFFNKGDRSTPQALKDFNYEDNGQQWVRVYAFMRVYNDQKSLVGIKLEEVTCKNEITNHFLKIFVAHQIRQKGALNSEKL